MVECGGRCIQVLHRNFLVPIRTASDAARTRFPGIGLLPGLRVGRRGQAVHVSQDMCCKAASLREQLKSRFWRPESGVCMRSSANAHPSHATQGEKRREGRQEEAAHISVKW
jgi:hypothetical protein